MLPDDITFRQLEAWEARVSTELGTVERVTPAVTARASVLAALEAGIVTQGEGVPLDEGAVPETSARVLWWMAEVIGKYIAAIKNPAVDPN